MSDVCRKFEFRPWSSILRPMKVILRSNFGCFNNFFKVLKFKRVYHVIHNTHYKGYICSLQECRTVALNLIDITKADHGN